MKILVNVHVPAISKNYDMLLPGTLSVQSITELIARSMEELTNHLYVSSKGEKLCLVEREIILQPESTLEENSVENGDHLMIL